MKMKSFWHGFYIQIFLIASSALVSALPNFGETLLSTLQRDAHFSIPPVSTEDSNESLGEEYLEKLLDFLDKCEQLEDSQNYTANQNIVLTLGNVGRENIAVDEFIVKSFENHSNSDCPYLLTSKDSDSENSLADWAFYPYTGFQDTSDPRIELAHAQFLNRTIERNSTVQKILLTLDYQSILPALESGLGLAIRLTTPHRENPTTTTSMETSIEPTLENFFSLLRNFIRLVRNTEKYFELDRFILVVTGVPMNDTNLSSISREIGSYLVTLKESEPLLSREFQGKDLERVMNILRAVTLDSGDRSYPNIMTIPQWEEMKKEPQSKLIEASRNALRNRIFSIDQKNIDIAMSSSPSDFGSALSPGASRWLTVLENQLLEEENSPITTFYGISVPKNEFQNLKMYFRRAAAAVDDVNDNSVRASNILRDFENIDEKYLFTQKINDLISNWRTDKVNGFIKQEKTIKPADFATLILQRLQEHEVRLPFPVLAPIEKLFRRFQKMQKFNPSPQARDRFYWKLKEVIISNLPDDIIWYDFLVDVQKGLSTHEIQKEKYRYDVQDIGNDWGRGEKNPEGERERPGLHIESSNIRLFLDNLAKLIKFSAQIEQILHLVRDSSHKEERLKELNELLWITIKDRMDCSSVSSDGVLTIKGHHILFSEVVDKNSECLVNNANDGNGVIRNVVIFATQTVFIDAGVIGYLINPDQNLNFYIYAPTWVKIGDQLIFLKGESGAQPKGWAGTRSDGSGEDGLPGNPGKPGGNFIGIGQRFINGYPNVNVDGGYGAWGQRGGNANKADRNGGNGGKGGLGGYGGTILFLTTQSDEGGGEEEEEDNGGENVPNKITRIPGQRGKDGNGGDGGYGYGSGRNGEAGVAGKPSSPEKPSPLVVLYIDFFRSFALKSMENLYERNVLLSFINEIDEASALTKYRPVFYLFYDFQSLLTVQPSVAHIEIDFSPIYESLLSRIHAEATDIPENKQNIKGYKKALFYLYSVTHSQICSLTSPFQADLVVDVEAYMKKSQKVLKELQAAEQNIKKLSIIKDTTDEYEKDLSGKIKEANSLITNVIQQDIKEMIDELFGNTDAILDEIEVLKEDAVKNANELNRKYDALKEQQQLKVIFGAYKMIGQGLQFLGPKGQVAGTVLNGMTSMAEGFLIDQEDFTPTMGELPDAITSPQEDFSKMTKEERVDYIDSYRVQLDDIFQYLINPQEGDDEESESERVSRSVSSSKPTLSSFEIQVKTKVEQVLTGLKQRKMKTSTNYIESYAALSETREFIENSRIEITSLLESTISSKKSGKTRALPIGKASPNPNPKPKGKPGLMGRLKGKFKNLTITTEEGASTAMDYLQMSTDIYKEYREDEKKLGEIAQAISMNRDNIKNLLQRQVDIDKVMKPMLQSMENDLGLLGKSLQNKSAAVLEVGKWRVQNLLRKLQQQLRSNFYEGFQIQEQMESCFNNIQNGMATLINVYDKIEDFSQQSKLATFIAKINSPAFEKVQVENSELNSAIQNIELIIQANIVQQRYEVSFGSFKMWIFPFADLFLRDLTLPSDVQNLIGDNDIMTKDANVNAKNVLSNLMDGVGERMKTILLRIGDYKSSVTEIHDYMRVNVDFENTERNYPFFTWTSQDFPSTMKDLLSASKTTFTATIDNSPVAYNATKFNEISINFRLNDPSKKPLEQELEQYLKYFRIILTHSGNSYYRYDQKYWIISTRINRFVFYYGNLKNPGKQEEGGVDSQVRKHDPCLSPYTMWEVELELVKQENRPIVQKFNVEEFSKYFDLELIGRGTYVNEKDSTRNLHLEKYYEADSSLE